MFRKLPRLTEVPFQLHHGAALHLTNVLLSSALCFFILINASKGLGPDIAQPGIMKRNVNPAMYYVRIPKNLVSLKLQKVSGCPNCL